jgi:hypothetical protein
MTASPDHLDHRWLEAYADVLSYAQEHGGPPPWRDRSRSATWCSRQRRLYRGTVAGTPLTADRITLLEKVPGWNWKSFTEMWDDRLAELRDFVAEHGALPVAESGPLGCWCAMQRAKERGSTKHGLSPEQKVALETIPGWFWSGDNEDRWNAHFWRVMDFATEHGRPPVDDSWCHRQRTARRANDPDVVADQAGLLEAIPGWFWNAESPHERWMQTYQSVCQYAAEHNKTPKQHDDDPAIRALGKWCNRQRQNKKADAKTPLTPEQVALMEALPGWYWGHYGQWDLTYARVLADAIASGGLPARGTTGAGWCNAQIGTYRGTNPHSRPLSPERIAKLEAIPGWVWKLRG